MGQKETNIPVSGMSDAHPMNIKENQYPLMLNGNIQTDITAGVTLTNEHSNLLCNNFPEGCVVIGTLYDPEDQVTFVWLTNPNNNHASDQIGYLSEYIFTDVNDFPVANPCTDCFGKNEQETPLEQRQQTPICTYTLITHAVCFNFELANPIRTGVLKKDNCGFNIYYTDGLNPMRFLKMNPGFTLHPDQCLITGYIGDCNGTPNTPCNDQCQQLSNPSIQCTCCQPVYADPTETNCNEASIFPNVNHIYTEAIILSEGGRLRAGTYQLAVCYASKAGERATRTFSCSNPVSIFDTNRTITDQVGYPTNYAIQFEVSNLDPSLYAYIDIFYIGTINSVTSVKQLPTINITSLNDNTLTLTLSDFEKGVDKTIDDVFQIFAVYNTADSATTAGNLLLWANLTGPPDLNLQKAVIGISPMVRWVTSESLENLYADGVNCSLYRGYLRDEVYPLGIVFERNNTLDTCVYPLVGRDLNVALCPEYFYTGQWIPTRTYLTINLPTVITSDVVLYNGVLYQCVTGSPDFSNIDIIPGTSGSNWQVFTPSYGCGTGGNVTIQDNSSVENQDVITFPGCTTELPNPSLTWQVYNTAYNDGLICNPVIDHLSCVAQSVQVICNSFNYSYSNWSSTTAYIAGDVVAYTSGNTYTCLIANTNVIPTSSLGTDWILNTTGQCVPTDCYISDINDCMPCSDNYPTAIADVRHPLAWNSATNYVVGDIAIEGGLNWQALQNNINVIPNAANSSTWYELGTACESWPPSAWNTTNICSAGMVRTATDANTYYTSNNAYLLCIDNTLINLPSVLSDPFAVLSSITQVLVTPASDNPWCKYDIVGGSSTPQPGSIQYQIINTADPTPQTVAATGGPGDVSCIRFMQTFTPPGQPVLEYLFPGVNLPSSAPSNFSPTNAIATFKPSPQNICNDYGPTAPLMYMLGYDVTPPLFDPCVLHSGSSCTDCVWTTNDYWNLGTSTALVGEVNNNSYQSYWYSFTATATQPTIIIKSKVFYKFGNIVMPVTIPCQPSGHTPGSDDFMQQGDIRIDVYSGSALLINPTYSTGKDSVNPATYYYDTSSAENDWGVLVIGDVANSSGQVTTAGQLPLTPGETYYVHIYLLSQGVTKVDKAPIPNGCGKENPCSPNSSPTADSCCPCYFANYAWLNLCMNSQSCAASDQVVVKIPETWEQKCTYNIFYQLNEVITSGCTIQTFDYGDFAYWESQTQTYPNSVDQNGNPVWGSLCGLPIRHFKFPDCLISPHQDQDLGIPYNPATLQTTGAAPFNPGRQAKIYPMGVRLNVSDVKAWLLYAVQQNWITDDQRQEITGFKIVRGNRATNKSIAAKGLIFDMWKYNEYDWVNGTYSNIVTYYPSYPFNDLRTDPYLETGGGSSFQHPFAGVSNNRFAFLSPETTFNNPLIGPELKLEASVYGQALGNFYEVKDHPKYVLLNQSGIDLAAALAAINLAGDLAIILGQLLGQFIVGVSDTIPVGSIVGFVGAFLDLAPKFFIYAQQWETLITNFGNPKNYATYYAATGNYHSSGALGAIQNSGNKRRLVLNSEYLLSGIQTTSDSGILSKINNFYREDSVYIYLQSNLTYTSAVVDSNLLDTSRFIMSSSQDGYQCRYTNRQSDISGYYASSKYYVPDQYGSLQDIEWLYTGEAFPINWSDSTQDTSCTPIYGGDTFIGRMTQKRKIPFFLDWPVGTTSPVDFQYERISNITDSRYYFNSVGEAVLNSSSMQFKPVENNFDVPCISPDGPSGEFFLNGVIYLFSYGIVSFIGESSFNLNFRYGTDPKINTFYPYQSDIESWTQEENVPISTPNSYFYNLDYSKQNRENVFCSQPIVYTNAPCVTTYRNRVINSQPDYDSDFWTDSWRIYLVNDYHDFPLVNGQLINIKGVEKERVIVNFENTTLSFNAYYTITTDAGVAQIGTANMFKQKPNEYAKADMGHGGTQHHAIISTKEGHFWTDAKRGCVFRLPPAGNNPYAALDLEEVSLPFRPFFRDNLPFYILKAFPEYPVDNNFWNVGISLCWDNRFDRLFVTKLDYALLDKWKGIVQYNSTTNTFYIVDAGTNIPIAITDTTYFCNKSWTIAYSPLTKSWISYYSFIPNYYIGHENYFQSGINFPQDTDISKVGIWNHLLTPKSYQVFYGTLYPFITDVVVKEQLINKQLQSIDFQADFLRFQNDYDYFYNGGVIFNKAIIWGENQNSGLLELVPQVSNNMAQGLIYPRANTDSTSVLVTRRTHNWRLNQFWDLVANKWNNIPPMILGCAPYLKQPNSAAINYQKPTFQRERFVSDYFTLRLINDIYSNYKIVNKWFNNDTIQSFS